MGAPLKGQGQLQGIVNLGLTEADVWPLPCQFLLVAYIIGACWVAQGDNLA